MTPVAAGNTNPVTLISYSFVGLGFNYTVEDFHWPYEWTPIHNFEASS